MLLVTSCFSHTGQRPQDDQGRLSRTQKKEARIREYIALNTLTAIVEQGAPDQPIRPEIKLRFNDLRTAFLALRDSAMAGHQAVRYRLLIAPGTYRLRKSMVWIEDEDSDLQREFVMRPAADGDVVISGAELNREGNTDQPWNDQGEWSTLDAELHRYKTDWPYSYGTVDLSKFTDRYQQWINNSDKPELLQRREMVVINGTILDQRLQHERLLPGTFKVIESENGNPGQLAIQLTQPLTANDEIEIPIIENQLILRRLDRVIISDIDFVRANPHHGNKAVIISGTQSIQLTDCSFNEHNWKGLGIGSSPLPTNRTQQDTIEIINCRANRNGGLGIGLTNLARVRIDNCELAENSWRAWAAGAKQWATGGSKIFHVHDVTVTNMHAHDNLTTGLWFDTGAKRVTIEQSTFENNGRDGLFIEASQGPVEIVGCRFLNNGRDGLRSNSSEHLTVRNNRFEYNQVGHFCLAGRNRQFVDFESGQDLHITAKNNQFSNNQFLGEPIWYVEPWLMPNGPTRYVEDTRFINNASWPYDPDNPFSQKPLPEDQH